MRSSAPRWSRNAHRARLLALYVSADELLRDFACKCAPAGELPAPCCRFAVSGHEPYPTAVELEEVRHAARVASVSPRDPRKLPMASGRPCPLLSDDNRCRIYESRPFGCRTYFCVESMGSARSWPRDAVNAIGRQIADLSATFSPRDPGPRPLSRALGLPNR
jgi:uncharacterized protein